MTGDKMTDKILVVCHQERDGNSILSVRVNGKVIGRVLEDRPHEWIIVPNPEKPPTYASLDAVVEALLERYKGLR